MLSSECVHQKVAGVRVRARARARVRVRARVYIYICIYVFIAQPLHIISLYIVTVGEYFSAILALYFLSCTIFLACLSLDTTRYESLFHYKMNMTVRLYLVHS